MLVYKNCSNIIKTFYGVTFQPGQAKEVPGYINDNKFQRLESMPQEPPKSVETPKRVETPKPTRQYRRHTEKKEIEKEVELPKVIEEVTTEQTQEEELDGSDNN